MVWGMFLLRSRIRLFLRLGLLRLLELLVGIVFLPWRGKLIVPGLLFWRFFFFVETSDAAGRVFGTAFLGFSFFCVRFVNFQC